MAIKNIVFDLGGVLIDWNPRYLYRKVFSEEKEMEHFLQHICNSDWNEQQDAGRAFAEGVRLLVEKYPQHEKYIRAYKERWTEMIGGAIEPTVQILERLHAAKSHKLFALTNWSAETFPYAKKTFPFLNHFQNIVVSGEINMKKPDPAIFKYLCRVSFIEPSETLFIDDNKPNIEAAQRLGFQVEHFQSAERLELRLKGI